MGFFYNFFNYISKYIIKIFIFFYFISGYDLIFLNDENILFNIYFLLVLLFIYNMTIYFQKFNWSNKFLLIREYYYKILLVKIFYLLYNFFLISNYNNYNNYMYYYKILYFFINSYLYSLTSNIYYFYFKLFLNELFKINVKMTSRIQKLKYNILLNIYYLVEIKNYFNKNHVVTQWGLDS